MLPRGGSHEGRHSGECFCVRISPFVEQEAEDGNGVGHGGSLVDQSAPINGSGVDVGTVVEEQTDLGLVVQAPEERRGFSLVAGVRVGPMFKEQFHRREIAKAGGVLERHGTRQIVRVDESGAGADQPFHGFGVAGADGRDQRRELRIDGFRRGVILDLNAEIGTLVDPGAEDSDLLIRERTGGRHLQSAVTIDEPANEFAFGAAARNDDWAIIAAAERILALVEAESGLLGFFAMAGVAFLREDRLDVLLEVDLPVGGRWQLGLSER